MVGNRLYLQSRRIALIVFDVERIGPWVCARAGGTWTPGRGTAIGREVNGRLVAGVLYEDYNHANVVCHIAGEGNWLNREYLWTIFDYPFKQLKVRRITVPVASVNARSQKFVIHLGFVREAVLADAHPQGDIYVYKMTAESCRWLRLKK